MRIERMLVCYLSEAPSCVRSKFELSSRILHFLSINAQLTLYGRI
nr:MAG TPA: hypothetical protein [Microviridae sp.]